MIIPEIAKVEDEAATLVADTKAPESKFITIFDTYKSVIVCFMVAAFLLGVYVGHVVQKLSDHV